jgi:large subunit ribosomal protein L1
MGKIRTRILGLEEIEKKQKEEQKKKAQEKKKIRAPGLKGGERMVEVDIKEAELAKMEKAKKIIEEAEKLQKKQVKEKQIKIHVRGKNYLSAKKQVDKNKAYSIKEAITLLKKIKYAKFDESVELHLNVEKTGLKGEVELPHSIGKETKVAIVDDKLLQEIEKGKIDFDVLIAHPSYMSKLVKYAKILGPKGLMPNPKAGTISTNPEETAKKFKKGLLRWKTEPKFPLIHQIIGKLSADEKILEENIKAFINSVGVKNIQSAFIKSTMSPSLKLDITKI